MPENDPIQPVAVEGHLDVDVKHSSLGRALRGKWALVALLVVVILGAFAFGALAWKEHTDYQRSSDRQYADLACISNWATQYTARSQAILDANLNRVSALDALAVTLLDPKSTTAERRTAVEEYRQASADYQAQAQRNPIPPPPAFTCFVSR